MNGSKFLPLVAAAATGVMVGSTIVATRFVIDQTSPGSLALLRYTVGVVCLLPPALFLTRLRFARRDVLPIALLGITQFGILIALLNYGVQFIPAARAALLFATTPLLTMVLAAALGFERLTLARTAGVLLTLAGVSLVLGEQLLKSGGSTQEWLGALALIGSALCGAVCSVLYRPYLKRYSTLPLSAFAMLAAVVFLTVVAAQEGFFQSTPHLNEEGWLVVAFIGISSGVGYLLWLWALKHASATRVTVFLTLSPVTATGLGALWLLEPVSPTFLVGLACVGVGLWLAYREV